MRLRILLLLGLSLGGLHLDGRAQRDKVPVYVGARVCATCHRGPEMGHQFSKWLLSNHAQAYAVLSKPTARRIAELSGIKQDPQEAAVCLGCHSTGAAAEEWEKDETFRMEDGVQCERCHGPGSEYSTLEVMRNPEAAKQAGLKTPTANDCKVCHFEKGSHVAVHRKPQLNMTRAMIQIAHLTPPKAEPPPPLVRETSASDGDRPHFVGVLACADCHESPERGHQFSQWKLSAHALAFARLATPQAFAIARDQGLNENPQESPACLKCHSTGAGKGPYEESFYLDEGVGCEGCHGPGSEYKHEALMMSRSAAVGAGLRIPTQEDCEGCHLQAHGKAFDYSSAWKSIEHRKEVQKTVEKITYKTPLNIAISPDSSELYVACEASNSVIVVDLVNRIKVAEIPVGGQPHDVVFSPDGKLVYVTNRLDDTISVLDVRSRSVTKVASVGDEPHAVLSDPSGEKLFVLNTSEDSISLIESKTLREVRRLSASRYPWSQALSPDGQTIVVTNMLSRPVAFRSPSRSELTVINVDRGTIQNRAVVEGANLLQGVAWHPSGDFALFTLNRTKNLVPMTRLQQGWTITNGLGILWRDGRTDQVLLDRPDISFPDPADIAITPDGTFALVTSSGSDRLAVVDVQKLKTLLESTPDRERKEILPNHLGRSDEFVRKHIETGDSPRGVAVAPDGKLAYVANALDDSISVVDLTLLEAIDRIDLGGPKQLTKVRLGEKIFHNAKNTFHRQFSCHTCHPDGHVDGLTYDIEPDGVGVSPVDNRTLRGILDTAPFKWEGTNPSLQRQCGPRLAVFFTRIHPFTPEELEALDLYISTIPRPPNRFRPLGAELTPAQRRGKELFGRRFRNDGSPIPEEKRCVGCHPPPLYTNHSQVDVGTKMEYDREVLFDVPHLTNIYDSAPYLHNGTAHTLEEIWTVYNPEDRHGFTNDMTKDQLNDLIEFLKTL